MGQLVVLYKKETFQTDALGQLWDDKTPNEYYYRTSKQHFKSNEADATDQNFYIKNGENLLFLHIIRAAMRTRQQAKNVPTYY